MSSKMSPTKRALLIASPFNGLRGPLNDVDVMFDALSKEGFEISRCCGESATRAGILEAWRNIIHVSSPDDTVVIYYSGHGGIVEDTAKKTEDALKEVISAHQDRWRYQFLVPMDFRAGLNPNEADSDTDYGFTGILDVELVHLLRATTDRTHNVTTIFDCCHSGRMVRDPSHADAVPRNLPEVQHAAVSRHIGRLLNEGQLQADTRLDAAGNRYAVRIAAAASTELAWEHEKSGRYGGAMTNALVKALREASKSGNEVDSLVSWRTTLQRVREVVNIDFPQQNPHVDGPETRLLFSLEETATSALVLHRCFEGEGILKAGRVSGVRQGNVYTLMPLGAERPTNEAQIGTATVTHFNGFKAKAKLSLASAKTSIPAEGVCAFLKEEALHMWPVTYPELINELEDAVGESKYLCRGRADQDGSFLAEFRLDRQDLILANGQGVQLASRHLSDGQTCARAIASKDLVKQAEQLARAQHLLSLTCADSSDEKLEHSLSVTFGTVKDGQPDRNIMQDGTGFVTEGERVYISLMNNGSKEVYVSVFNINAAGKISLVSGRGIETSPQQTYVLGTDEFGFGLEGLLISWPIGIPKAQAITESLVLILTDSPVNLRHLDNNTNPGFRGHVGPSSLERLAFSLATGATRDMGSESHRERVRYDTLHIPFTLTPPGGGIIPIFTAWDGGGETCELRAEDVPLVEEMVQHQDIPLRSPYLEQAARGNIGAFIRRAKGIPACVWVVNEHDEDISVVVSKYRPNRMLSSGGVNVSTTGAGIDLSSTSFLSPACKKTLAARSEGKDASTGAFPLWTWKEGFGVISIFKGPNKELYIENDRIPLGATAFFSNKPDLRIVDYDGKEKLS
ncbi:hypothetical protein LY76DRAFT_688178 [Colletotrichum caudatum]|nr:hypothetical protein LY76DRAFT_688178 [Colletotrichum caudatum]